MSYRDNKKKPPHFTYIYSYNLCEQASKQAVLDIALRKFERFLQHKRSFFTNICTNLIKISEIKIACRI